MLSNHDIDSYVARHPHIASMYGGTLALDELPRRQVSTPTLYIVNSDPSYKPGEHWLATFVGLSSDTSQANGASHGHLASLNEHFDSAGRAPLVAMQDFLTEQSTQPPARRAASSDSSSSSKRNTSPSQGYMYNHVRVQDFNSDTCGMFCLMYIYYRSLGLSFSSFLSMFSSNLKENDSIVKYFYKMTK